MHNPERDPFYEGLWADIQEGIDDLERGDSFDGEEVFRELLGETEETEPVETTVGG